MKRQVEQREILAQFRANVQADLERWYEVLQKAESHPERRFPLDKFMADVLSSLDACKSLGDSQARMDAAPDVPDSSRGSVPADGDEVGGDIRDGHILSHAVIEATAPRSRQGRGRRRRR